MDLLLLVHTPSMKPKNLSFIYDLFMVIVIFLSLMPLLVDMSERPIWVGLDQAVLFIFGLDYLLQAHWNYRYCLSAMGVIDFLSILPGLPWVRVLKLVRLLRAARALKLLRFWEDSLLIRALQKQKTALLLVWSLAVCYVFAISVVMYTVEPSLFKNFPEALYFAVITLTSVGFGDIVPVTLLGRTVTMVSIFVGTALVALPSGIIAAGYMSELGRRG